MKKDTEHTARAQLDLARYLDAFAFHTCISSLGLLLGTVAGPTLFQPYVINNSASLFCVHTFSQLEMSF